jgi:hypothetical protein
VLVGEVAEFNVVAKHPLFNVVAREEGPHPFFNVVGGIGK